MIRPDVESYRDHARGMAGVSPVMANRVVDLCNYIDWLEAGSPASKPECPSVASVEVAAPRVPETPVAHVRAVPWWRYQWGQS